MTTTQVFPASLVDAVNIRDSDGTSPPARIADLQEAGKTWSVIDPDEPWSFTIQFGDPGSPISSGEQTIELDGLAEIEGEVSLFDGDDFVRVLGTIEISDTSKQITFDGSEVSARDSVRIRIASDYPAA
jgi:hypothetical protein